MDDVETIIPRNFFCLGAASFLRIAALALMASVAQGQAAPDASAAPATPPIASPPLQSHSVSGIKNFGQVTPRLFRGAQPSEEGYDLLAKMGVEIIVDFRNEKDKIESERAAVESRKLRFVSIPWSAFHRPTTGHVREFFELLRANPEKRVFVHCELGADRTGTMVALYRIAGQQWKVPEAVREMHAYHYHGFWFPHLAHYVEEFPEQLESDPALRSGAPPAPQPVSP